MSEELKKIEKRKVDKTSVYWNLQSVNVSNMLDTKQGMKYLSWSWAWAEVKKLYPKASYIVYENKKKDYLPIWGNSMFGYFVRVSVTIEDITHESRLPVMNGANKAMKDHGYSYEVYNRNQQKYEVKKVMQMTVMEINKTVQRALVKACAMHGLGLNVWKGEDLPELVLDTITSKMEKEIVNEISLIDDLNELKEYFGLLKEDYCITKETLKLYEQREQEIKADNGE